MMASLITGGKKVQRKKEFGFPKMSLYYQPDTATLRVISLRSLKYQNSRKNSTEATAKAPDVSFLKNIFPQRQLLKKLFFPFVIKGANFVPLDICK